MANAKFAVRAEILAREIKAAAPDLVSLQEVTTWSTGASPEAQVPFGDQLALLRAGGTREEGGGRISKGQAEECVGIPCRR